MCGRLHRKTNKTMLAGLCEFHELNLGISSLCTKQTTLNLKAAIDINSYKWNKWTEDNCYFCQVLCMALLSFHLLWFEVFSHVWVFLSNTCRKNSLDREMDLNPVTFVLRRLHENETAIAYWKCTQNLKTIFLTWNDVNMTLTRRKAVVTAVVTCERDSHSDYPCVKRF